MADINQQIVDNEIGMIMLSGLPDSFESIITGYAATHNVVTSEEVQRLLLDEDDRRDSKETETVLISKTKTTSLDKQITCHNCGKTGHIRPRCPAFKKHKKGLKTATSSKGKNDASSKEDMTNKTETKSKGSLLFSASVPETSFSAGNFDINDWYLDTCCSGHISSRKDWMEDFDGNSSKEF